MIGYHFYVSPQQDKIHARKTKSEFLENGTEIHTYEVSISAPNILLPNIIHNLPTRQVFLRHEDKEGPCPTLIVVGKMHQYAFENHCSIATIAERYDVMKELYRLRWWPEYHGVNMSLPMWYWSEVSVTMFILYSLVSF